jgi:hypothetical protein
MVKPRIESPSLLTVEMLNCAVEPLELVVVLLVVVEVDVELDACGSIVLSVATVCEKSDDRVEYRFAPLRSSM